MAQQKKAKLKEKVYSIMKSRILNFELKPGEKFFETEISEKLGVSRTPIREALNRLEHEGLVKSLPNKGYSVSDLTITEIEELFEIREVLEILALRAAAKNARREDWIHLEETVKKKNLHQNEDLEERHGQSFKEAHEFHQEIARISGKETLKQIIDMISEKIYRFQWMNLFLEDRGMQSRNEHVAIINYLKAGKIDDAVAATQEHIRHSKNNILHLLQKKKDLLYIG